MLTLIELLRTLSNVYDRVTGNTTYEDALKTLKIDNATVSLATANGNMINFMKNHIVEPSIFISKNAYNRPDANSILEHTVDVYAAFYLQAFKTLINVYDLPTKEAISVLASKGFDYESLKNEFDGMGLMDLEGMKSLPNISMSIGKDAEANSIAIEKSVAIGKDDNILSSKTIIRTLEIVIDSKATTSRETSLGKDSVMTDRLVVNIPIIIKANVNVVDLDTISNSVEHRSSNAGFFKRILQWKVGVISAKDFFLAGDLVESYKKGALTKENFGKTLDKSSSNHINIESLLDKRVGLNKIVFSYIMTDSELELLGKRMGYNINKGSDKTDMMNALLALNITSINEDRDMVSVYINGISGMTPSPIKKLSKSGGKDGGDAIEMLASALMSNKSVF